MEKTTTSREAPRFLLSLWLLIGLLLAVTATGARADAEESETSFPFEVGEQLTYDLRWGVFSAGQAVLTVNPMAEIDGEEVFHFTLSVRTNSFVDRFYKVRDQMDGFLRADLQGSVLYLVKKEAGKNLRDVEVVFDEETNTAQYANFGEKRDAIRVFPGTFDPLSVVFAFRAMSMDPDSAHQIPVSDGRRASMGVGYVRERERVSVAAGRFDTVLVEPDMQDVGGVFDRSDDAYVHIWFSDDEQRVPVKVSSKVAVGSFRAELISIETVEFPEEYEPMVLAR